MHVLFQAKASKSKSLRSHEIPAFWQPRNLGTRSGVIWTLESKKKRLEDNHKLIGVFVCRTYCTHPLSNQQLQDLLQGDRFGSLVYSYPRKVYSAGFAARTTSPTKLQGSGRRGGARAIQDVVRFRGAYLERGRGQGTVDVGETVCSGVDVEHGYFQY
jgi:hypothetical protein